MTNQIGPCHTCGDIGVENFLMTCFSCREVKEHIYCASICLRAVPEMWLCQVCRSSARVLQIADLVDNNNTNALANDNDVDHYALRSDILSNIPEISMPDLPNGGSRIHSPSHGLMLLAHACPDIGEVAALTSNDTSPSKKQHSGQFLAFPSPKRRRRSKLQRAVKNTKENKRQRPQSSHPCVFHQID